MEKLARDIHYRKQQHRVFSGTIPTDKQKSKAKSCWICERDFDDSDVKVLDHCHFKGNFLGWAHEVCNVNRKTQNFTPIIAHNLSHYDLHHLCNALHNCHSRNKFTIIPNTDETYIILTLKVFIEERPGRKNRLIQVYEDLRFLDSFRFMNTSLEKLVDSLPDDSFRILDKHFEDYQTSDVKLLHGKGFYPYSYIDSFDRFKESKLPPLSSWINSLSGKNNIPSITKSELEKAQKIFGNFDCFNLGDYHDLYLSVDTLQLADVFEKFRTLCFQTYGLDCAQYFSAPNLAGDAFLKICEPELELLTNRDHLDFVENLMRGGVASVFAKRFFEANNEYLPNSFNPYKEHSFGLMIDANNLYGGIMKNFPLPFGNFETDTTTSLQTILETNDESPCGFIVECDLEYPDDLHDDHKDFPLAPTKESVKPFWLSEYQFELLNDINLKGNFKVKKLLQTLYNKERYTLHYITLKLYVSLGLRVKKVHRCLKFSQSKWLSAYIDLNTDMRQRAANKFEENFFKLMSNCAYGKCCESKRNHQSISLVRTEEELWTNTEKFNVKTLKVFNNDLVAVTMRKYKIFWNKPTIVGATILDLSKMYMFDFHYNTMKKHFDCSLLYSDTDSLTYEIRTIDLYKDLKESNDLNEKFDFSNYERDNNLFDDKNKMVVLKFKDELKGRPMESFCALKSKMYSITTEG